ncbi:hypothetical protein [Corynebacterium argentoratense]|nr:hypothetical protein [Corynebacterium argentoratense]
MGDDVAVVAACQFLGCFVQLAGGFCALLLDACPVFARLLG